MLQVMGLVQPVLKLVLTLFKMTVRKRRRTLMTQKGSIKSSFQTQPKLKEALTFLLFLLS